MRYFTASLAMIMTILALSVLPTISAAQDTDNLNRLELQKSTAALSDAARRASLSAGVADPGAIACDGFVCTCQGTFDCAWLAYFCSVSGGIRGFDGECYTPARDPDTNRAVLDLQLTLMPNMPVGAECKGIFCTCTGGENSNDCQRLEATCIDDVQCIGDSCGCIGGSVDDS